MKVLVVINPFAGLSKGDRVTDPAQINSILAGEHAHNVVQSDHSDVKPLKSAE